MHEVKNCSEGCQESGCSPLLLWFLATAHALPVADRRQTPAAETALHSQSAASPRLYAFQALQPAFRSANGSVPTGRNLHAPWDGSRYSQGLQHQMKPPARRGWPLASDSIAKTSSRRPLWLGWEPRELSRGSTSVTEHDGLALSAPGQHFLAKQESAQRF